MEKIYLTTKQTAKIKRALKALEDVRQEVASETGGDIQWYLEDCGNLCLMNGNSHDENQNPRQDAIIEIFNMKSASGGAW